MGFFVITYDGSLSPVLKVVAFCISVCLLKPGVDVLDLLTDSIPVVEGSANMLKPNCRPKRLPMDACKSCCHSGRLALYFAISGRILLLCLALAAALVGVLLASELLSVVVVPDCISRSGWYSDCWLEAEINASLGCCAVLCFWVGGAEPFLCLSGPFGNFL